MPVITTGVPLISAIGQSGQDFADLAEYQQKNRDRRRQRQREDFEFRVAQDKEEQRKKQISEDQLGGQAVESLAEPSSGVPSSVAGAIGASAGAGGLAGGIISGSATPYGYHDAEMRDLAAKHTQLARQIAPHLSGMSPQMQERVLGSILNAFRADHDELQKNHVIESARSAGALGSFGSPDSQYSKTAIAHIAQLAQAGDTKGALEAMEKLSEPVFRRQQEDEARKEKVAKAAGVIQMARQNGLPAVEAEMLARKYAGGVVGDKQFEEEFPHLLLGHVKDPVDDTWHVDQASADQYAAMRDALRKAQIEKALADADESKKRGEYYDTISGPKGWMGKAMDTFTALSKQGVDREKARATMAEELFKSWGKRSDPAQIQKIVDSFYPPSGGSKKSLKRTPKGSDWVPQQKMTLATGGDDESAETGQDNEQSEGEAKAAAPISIKGMEPDEAVQHTSKMSDEDALQYLQNEVKGQTDTKLIRNAMAILRARPELLKLWRAKTGKQE